MSQLFTYQLHLHNCTNKFLSNKNYQCKLFSQRIQKAKEKSKYESDLHANKTILSSIQLQSRSVVHFQVIKLELCIDIIGIMMKNGYHKVGTMVT